MKLLLTLLVPLLTASALTSSKPRHAPRDPNINVLATDDQRPHPVEKFLR